MPKLPTYPHLFDDCKKISISSLQKAGLLIPGKRISTEITWTREGEVTGRVSIMINMNVAMPHLFDPYVELRYSQNGEPIHYSVRITSKLANIGKGVVYYFVCDKTNKKCRIL